MAWKKRRRPKVQRAGCLFCKPHKANKGAWAKNRPMLRVTAWTQSQIEETFSGR